MRLSVDQIRMAVYDAVEEFNSSTKYQDKVTHVSLFGSYAKGTADSQSDVDLLVTFTSAVVSLFTLAHLLSCFEDRLGTDVDVVQFPMPSDTLLDIEKAIPIYEAI